MKTFLTTIFFLLLLSACSTDGAFTYFEISPDQERSEISIQSYKVSDKEQVAGLVTVLYLNEVMPKRFQNKEYFYISLYSKSQSSQINFYLNGHNAQYVEELAPRNEFSKLTNFSGDWQRFYLVAFDKEGKKLNFILKNAHFSTPSILFTKED